MQLGSGDLGNFFAGGRFSLIRQRLVLGGGATDL